MASKPTRAWVRSAQETAITEVVQALIQGPAAAIELLEARRASGMPAKEISHLLDQALLIGGRRRVNLGVTITKVRERLKESGESA
jgi:hypothetical protein